MRKPREAEQSRRPRATPQGSRVPCQPLQGNSVTCSSSTPGGWSGFTPGLGGRRIRRVLDLTRRPCCERHKDRTACLDGAEHAVKSPLFLPFRLDPL